LVTVMKYDSADLRSHDPADRIEFIRSVMLVDADRLSHAFEHFARESVGDPAAHSFYRRMAICVRDFHSSLVQIFGSMPASLRDATK
jgi:hypothetical protein